MLAAKGKGGSTSHRYRPASEYDDATLAQKREYWRNKKRQQRARLSEQRGKPAKEKVSFQRDSAAGALPNFALSRPFYSNVSCVASLKRRGTDGVGSKEAASDQEERRLETANVKGFQLTSGSVVAPGATATRVVSSPSSSGTQLGTSSSGPPVIDSSVTNGSSIKAEPQPCVSVQGRSVPRTRLKAHVLSPIPPMTDPLATTQMKRAPISSKAAVPRSGSKSALVSRRRAEGPPPLPSVSEEEKAARRREHWRLKKREQRAKLAAQTANVKERAQIGGGTHQRTTAQKTVSGFMLPSQTFLRGMGQKLCSVRVKVPFIAARHDSDKPQSRSVSMLPAGPVKVQNSQKSRREQPTLTCDVNSGRKPADSQRKASCLGPSDPRGIAPWKSPRLKSIDAQKKFISLGNLRCKSPSVASVLSTRGLPKADPNDSSEQIIAKRREYWRIKKREQRAKLSLESKTRAQEKQSLMRVRRYQQILADLRKARALTHSTGSVLSPDSETIGGFIKEDGTLTVNLPSYRNAAGGGCKEEHSGGPQNVQMTRAQHGAGTTRGRVDPVQESQAPPQGVQPVHRPPGLLLIKPHISSSDPGPPSATSQRVGPLTHSSTPQNTGSTSGSGGGSCVMKVAVSSCAPSQNVPLPEEDRIAKRRGYWRVKKREQRAARAILLKRSSALLKRRAQRPDLATAMTTRAEDTPHGNDIKQESEPTSDLRSPPEQPPSTLPAPPGLQLELDPSLYSDSQATTLLAVASMKKLLEESLSSVAECQTEPLGLQIKPDEDDCELDVKPAVSQLIFENGAATSAAADATLQMKGWDPGSDDAVPKDSVSPQLNSSLVSDMLPSFPTCSEVELLTCEHSSQPLSNLTENRTVEASGSPCRTQRLISNNLQDICSPEPAQLHHLPAMSLYHPHQQQQHQGWSQSSSLPPAQAHTHVGAERSGLTSLQRKREYWKLMKRQQRARLRAKQKEQPPKSSSRPLVENIQVPGPLKDVGRCKPAPQPHLSLASVAAGTAIPRVLVVRRTAANPERSPDTLQVKLPMTSREDRMSVGSFDDGCLHKQPHRSLAPCFSALNPPDNPLSSIHLRSIELPGQTSNFIKNASCGLQSQSSSNLAPISTLVPPKPIPGESEEDFLRRKREYWRIKKKEQRARKAVRDKEPLAHVVSNSWSPVLPVQGLQTSGAAQDPGKWGDPSVDSEPLKSVKVDPDPSRDTPQVADEPEPLLTDYGGYNEDEGRPSEVVWRNRYLMDYDPLNQLLVCMVCGELQYSHTLEGVRAHIDEAHPHTMTLDPREKQQILEGWDEQVSQRERFFTSQLQQHSTVLAESYRS
uniref:SPIN-DOC-like zinc-finger domain-containing protein n=1 Tax=Nothobranchius rachovii TaxID=451742 RepID=A0A1A8R8G1_9TELE